MSGIPAELCKRGRARVGVGGGGDKLNQETVGQPLSQSDALTQFDPNRPLHTLESGSLVLPRARPRSDNATSKATQLRYLSARGMLHRKARVGFPELQEKGSVGLSIIMASAAFTPSYNQATVSHV